MINSAGVHAANFTFYNKINTSINHVSSILLKLLLHRYKWWWNISRAQSMTGCRRENTAMQKKNKKQKLTAIWLGRIRVTIFWSLFLILDLICERGVLNFQTGKSQENINSSWNKSQKHRNTVCEIISLHGATRLSYVYHIHIWCVHWGWTGVGGTVP